MPKIDGELSDEELEIVVGGSKDMKHLFEHWRGYVKEDVDLKIGSVEHPHQNLNESLWDDEDQLRSEVKEKLLEIARQFISKTQGADAEIKDITFTGSLANYNYSMLSDIDLHILIDFEELNDDVGLVRDYFNAVKALWNYLHDIRIKGYEVEVYVQNATEPHVSSGVYSIMNDEWIKKPESKEVDIDNELIAKKAESLMDQIDRALEIMEKGKHQEAHDRAIKIRKKIKKFRQAGLEGEGEYSVENLAFKTLRNNGYLGKLSHLKRDAYDKMMSLKEQNTPTDAKYKMAMAAADKTTTALQKPGKDWANDIAQLGHRAKDYYDLATTGKPIDRSPDAPGGGGFGSEAGALMNVATMGKGGMVTQAVQQILPNIAQAIGSQIGSQPTAVPIATNVTALPTGTGAHIPARPATTPTTTATVPTIPTTATAGMTSPTTPMSTTAPEPPDADAELTSEDSSSEETCERKPSRHRIKIIRKKK
jgi:hypothetical protein